MRTISIFKRWSTTGLRNNRMNLKIFCVNAYKNTSTKVGDDIWTISLLRWWNTTLTVMSDSDASEPYQAYPSSSWLIFKRIIGTIVESFWERIGHENSLRNGILMGFYLFKPFNGSRKTENPWYPSRLLPSCEAFWATWAAADPRRSSFPDCWREVAPIWLVLRGTRSVKW